MSNISFINTLYRPERYERYRLERLQEEINNTIAFIAYDTKTKKEYNLRKYFYHMRMRERIRLVPDP